VDSLSSGWQEEVGDNRENNEEDEFNWILVYQPFKTTLHKM
jgi:hypothetical protein